MAPRRPSSRLLATVVACLALAACGDDEKGEAEQALRDYIQAADEGDRAACGDLVTERFLRAQTGETGEAGRRACERSLGSLEELNTELISVEENDVEGDRATVVVRQRVGSEGEDEVIARFTYELLREDGRFRVDGKAEG